MKQPLSMLVILVVAACNNASRTKTAEDSIDAGNVSKENIVQVDSLPQPYATPSVKNFSNVLGWPEGKTPVAPPGFVVTKFADSLENPRWIYVLANGDVLVAEAASDANVVKKAGAVLSGKAKSENSKSANRITLFRDANQDGYAEFRKIFLENLRQPFGMLAIGEQFYVANTDGLMVFPFKPESSVALSTGKQILSLPAGGYNNHWTRNIIANKDNSKIYIAVGSGSNVAEHGMDHEKRRANILEINPDGSGERIYASGLRNPVGMDWAPGSGTLFTVVNERDELGDDLVPDYLTSVQAGGFYGWPYFYFGGHEDPRIKSPDTTLKQRVIKPDLALGSHTASLGLVFYKGSSFPAKYRNGAFIGQRGSWNRSALSGYKVIFVPFSGGRPSGAPEDFLTGFIADSAKSEVFGRPVGVAEMKHGALLVADDAGNTVWCIRPQ